MVCIRSSLSDNTLGSSKTAEKEFLGEGVEKGPAAMIKPLSIQGWCMRNGGGG